MPLTLLQKALTKRYYFNETYPLLKVSLSKSLGQLECNIDSLHSKHPSGFYRQKFGTEMLIYVQDPEKDPPSFFATSTGNKHERKRTLRKSLKKIRNYLLTTVIDAHNFKNVVGQRKESVQKMKLICF